MKNLKNLTVITLSMFIIACLASIQLSEAESYPTPPEEIQSSGVEIPPIKPISCEEYPTPPDAEVADSDGLAESDYPTPPDFDAARAIKGALNDYPTPPEVE